MPILLLSGYLSAKKPGQKEEGMWPEDRFPNLEQNAHQAPAED